MILYIHGRSFVCSRFYKQDILTLSMNLLNGSLNGKYSFFLAHSFLNWHLFEHSPSIFLNTTPSKYKERERERRKNIQTKTSDVYKSKVNHVPITHVQYTIWCVYFQAILILQNQFSRAAGLIIILMNDFPHQCDPTAVIKHAFRQSDKILGSLRICHMWHLYQDQIQVILCSVNHSRQ